ncbi:hypothetical protein EBR96_07150 [bacterium]|nr:hypothetical protein [bacterium]
MKRHLLYSAIIALIGVSAIGSVKAAEPYMLPYRDTMVMMVHGVNADRYTWVKSDKEGAPDFFGGDSNKWSTYLVKELGINQDYIKLYSFSEKSGYHERNIMELGGTGYLNPASQITETNGVVRTGMVINSGINSPIAKSGLPLGISFQNGSRIAIGSGGVDIGLNIDLRSDKKVQSGIWDHMSWVEQAKVEFKRQLFRNSAINLLNNPIWEDENDIPDALLPSKLVMVSHSQGNIAVRGYLHSGQLARSGFFDHMAHPQPYAGYQSAMAALKDILGPGIGGILQLPSSRQELTPVPSDAYS